MITQELATSTFLTAPCIWRCRRTSSLSAVKASLCLSISARAVLRSPRAPPSNVSRVRCLLVWRPPKLRTPRSLLRLTKWRERGWTVFSHFQQLQSSYPMRSHREGAPRASFSPDDMSCVDTCSQPQPDAAPRPSTPAAESALASNRFDEALVRALALRCLALPGAPCRVTRGPSQPSCLCLRDR